MANKLKSRGTTLLQEISAVYTAFPQLSSISIAGRKSTTYDSTTLDGPVTRTHDADGYADAATISGEGFYDPDDAVWAAYEALLLVPVDTNFKVTYTDATPTSEIFAGTGFGLDKSAAPGDGVKGSINIQTSGDPT